MTALWWDYTNAIFLGLTLIVNFVYAAGVLGVTTIKDISESRKSKFTAPSWLFAVMWTIVYGLQITFFVLQFIYEPVPSLNEAIVWYYIVLSLANMAWCVLFSWKKITLSVYALYVMLAMLIWIYVKMDINYIYKGQDLFEVWIYFPTFSIYLGWISFAVFANQFFAGIYVTNVEDTIEEVKSETKESVDNLLGNEKEPTESIAVAMQSALLFVFIQFFIFQFGDVFFACTLIIAIIAQVIENKKDKIIRWHHLIIIVAPSLGFIAIKLALLLA